MQARTSDNLQYPWDNAFIAWLYLEIATGTKAIAIKHCIYSNRLFK